MCVPGLITLDTRMRSCPFPYYFIHLLPEYIYFLISSKNSKKHYLPRFSLLKLPKIFATVTVK